MIGETVKKIRLFKKISQKELAAKLGISPNTLYRYEHGDISVSLDMLNKIAAALEVSVDTLLVNPDEIPDNKPTPIYFDNKPAPDGEPKTMGDMIKGAKRLQESLEKAYTKLNTAGKTAVNEYAEYLTTKEEYTKEK
jgi:transcriptional regulator with XRE-family HTH domain